MFVVKRNLINIAITPLCILYIFYNKPTVRLQDSFLETFWPFIAIEKF